MYIRGIFYLNLNKIAKPNKISKTPTTINTMHKIFVNSKSKSEVVTVDEVVVVVFPDVVVLPKFIFGVAA